jgi:hypothetical protein
MAGIFGRTLYLANPAQRSSRTGPPGLESCPSYVAWRAVLLLRRAPTIDKGIRVPKLSLAGSVYVYVR